MLRSSLSLCLAIFLAVGLTGCGDEQTPAAPGGGGTGAGFGPPPNTGGSGGTGSGGTGGTAGSGGMAGTAGGAGNGGVGGNGGGGMGGFPSLAACDNATDFAALASLEPDSNARMEAASLGISRNCVNTLPNQAFYESCVADGMRALLPGLSPECAQCYGELASCSIPGGCNIPCANDSCDQIQCRMCPGYPACENALDTCTGRTPPDCGST